MSSDEKKPNPNQWKKGQSGNPGGRSKGVEARLRALLADDFDAIALAMRDIALGKSPKGTAIDVKASDCTKAAEWIYNRAFGHARQSVDVVSTVMTEEQAALLAALTMTPHERRARLAELADEPDEPEPDGSAS